MQELCKYKLKILTSYRIGLQIGMRHIQGHFDCLFSNSVHVFVRPGELQINHPNVSHVLPHVLTFCCVYLGLTVEVRKKYYKYVSVTSFFVSMRKGNISSHLIAESA